MFKVILTVLVFGSFSNFSNAQVVARVGKTDITLKEFNEKYAEVRNQTINPPSAGVFLDDLIRLKIGIQEAEQLQIEKEPEVKERLQQELFKALVEKMIGKSVSNINIKEAEMRQYYKSNPEFRSSHILIEFKTDATAEQKNIAYKRAMEIYEEVNRSKRSFEELVKLYSDDTLSKNSGGDVGYQSRLTVVPTYYDALLSLKPNQISKPIQTLYGYHIIKVTGRRSYQDANQWQIRAGVFEEKRRQLFDAYFKKLAPKYPVTKNEKLIKSL